MRHTGSEAPPMFHMLGRYSVTELHSGQTLFFFHSQLVMFQVGKEILCGYWSCALMAQIAILNMINSYFVNVSRNESIQCPKISSSISACQGGILLEI